MPSEIKIVSDFTGRVATLFRKPSFSILITFDKPRKISNKFSRVFHKTNFFATFNLQNFPHSTILLFWSCYKRCTEYLIKKIFIHFVFSRRHFSLLPRSLLGLFWVCVCVCVCVCVYVCACR